MKPANLIPAPRLAALRRRSHRNRCVAGCVVYAAAAVAACGGARMVWGEVDPRMPTHLADAAADVERLGKAIGGTKAQLEAVEATLRSSRSIAEQPDWSALMALLAAKAGDEVILKSCAVVVKEPPKPAPPPPGAKPPTGGAKASAAPAEPSATLSLNGLGRSQLAVSRFVLRLEASGLFARVTLIDTSREPFLNKPAIGFRVECSLDDPGPQAGQTSTATPTALKSPAVTPPPPPATRPASGVATTTPRATPATRPSTRPATAPLVRNAAPQQRPPAASTRPAYARSTQAAPRTVPPPTTTAAAVSTTRPAAPAARRANAAAPVATVHTGGDGR